MTNTRWDLIVITTAMFVFLVASVENPLWFLCLMVVTPLFYAFCLIDPNEEQFEQDLGEKIEGKSEGAEVLNFSCRRPGLFS